MKKAEIKKLYGGKHSCGLHTLQVQAKYLPLDYADYSIFWGQKQGAARQTNEVRSQFTEKFYRYQLNPSIRATGTRYTLLSGRDLATTIANMTERNPYYVERADFAFDSFTHSYDELRRLNKAVRWLVIDRFSLDNNGITMDEDGSVKSMFAKSQSPSITGKPKRPFENECYDKTKQYPNCGIYARLELRCLDAGGTIEEAARRTISMLGELLTEDSYNRLIEYHSNILRDQWHKGVKRSEWRTWFCEHQWYIFSLEQFRAIVGELTGNNGEYAVKRYNDSCTGMPWKKLTSVTLISRDKLSAYIERLQACLRAWLADYLRGLSDVQRAGEDEPDNAFDAMSDTEIDYLAALAAEREERQRESQQAFLEYMEELNEEDPAFTCWLYEQEWFKEIVESIDGGKYLGEEQLNRPQCICSFGFGNPETLEEMCNFDAEIDSLMD